MRIFKINNYASFTGVRKDRNAVEQLKHDNDYDLNLPNQRRISTAIEELGKIPGEDNINFLLDISQNLRYGTNIDIGKKPYNNWREKLNNAIKKSFELSDKSVQERLAPKLNILPNEHKELSKEELELLANRELLLAKINPEELHNIKNKNIANLQRNLSYFIVSSEVPIKQKIYVLKRLNYFMSDDYKINPQLKDRKTQILAEVLNDMVINTPESGIPNIKAVNQRNHGTCVAISICRKALAYEDKANYVDMILTELDDNPNMMVYDRTNLGKHQKVPIPKADIDYNYAIQKGYRIIDTSVMNWMNAADTTGAFNDVVGAYYPFDKDNFGTFEDTHIHRDINDQSKKYQDYFRSCKKAKDALAKCKKTFEKDKYLTSANIQNSKNQLSMLRSEQALAIDILKQVYPSFDNPKLREILNDIQPLALHYSSEKDKLDENKARYSFITNEESDYKAEKLVNYLTQILPNTGNKKVLQEKAPELVELISDLKSARLNRVKSEAEKYIQNLNLFKAAAAYRTMRTFELSIFDKLNQMMIDFNILDAETYLIKNLNKLSENIRNGKINPELKEKLHKRFEDEVLEKIKETNSQDAPDEILAQVLDEHANTVKLVITSAADDIYNSVVLNDKKFVLFTELESIKNELEYAKDKQQIEFIAFNFNMKPDKKAIIKTIDEYMKILSDENCTDEQYEEIFNKSGHKSHLIDMKKALDNAAKLIFDDKNENYIAGFNLINGLKKDASYNDILDLYNTIANNFNSLSAFIALLQDALEIKSDNGTILNSPDPKYEVLKKCENMGEILTEQELISLRDKFDRYYNARFDENGNTIKFKDLPKSITTFTPMEKNALYKIRKNVNFWYANSSRKLNDIYSEIKEPLEELNREIGFQKGEYWTRENDSGLMDNQALKIFEHMTDRPYYKEKNIRAGIEKIKNAPYSGSSMTSVKSDEQAMHGQYVADIKPINDENKIKNIIFHDNTWGALEHENIWIDKQGFLRTDYSSEYGGENGYITNENYFNGKFDDNIIDKKGEFKPKKIPNKEYNKLLTFDEEYSFPMISSIVLQGVSPSAMKTVKDIKQTLLLPSYDYLDDLKEYASQMTQQEIKDRIKKIETAGTDSENTYKILLRRIKGYNNFDKGIDTEEKYYKLSPNDKLRLYTEKVAIKESYDDIPDINAYNIEVKSHKELDYLRKKLRHEARNNFDYIMAKNIDILKYAAESSKKDIYEELKIFAKNNNKDLNNDAMRKTVNSMKDISPGKYNGSISQGIDLMLANFEKSFKLNIDVDDKNAKEFIKIIKPIIENNLIITENDIKTGFDTYRNEQIASWIDRVFSPKTDEEFAQILNNLRNMTTKDFKKNFDSKISDKDLGIKSINGYDILKMIRSENESIEKAFINAVFGESYYRDIDASRTKAHYDLKKLSRDLSGATYIRGIRTFDDVYSDFYRDFQDLTIKKEFAKYKDGAFRKYFTFPAYPEIELTSDKSYEESLSNLYEALTGYMGVIYFNKNMFESIELVKALKEYSDEKLPEQGTLTPKQFLKISKLIEKFLYINASDESIQNIIIDGKKLLASADKDAESYKKYIESLYDLFKSFKYRSGVKTLKKNQKNNIDDMNAFKKEFIINNIDPKYQNKAFEILNRWISEKVKASEMIYRFNSNITDESLQETKDIAEKYNQNFENADIIFDEFRDLYKKHYLPDSPIKYMNEYLLLCAKDAKYSNEKLFADGTKRKKKFKDFRDNFESDLQSLLFKSDMMQLQYMLMKCAKKGNLNAVRDAFKDSTLELRNGTVVTLDSDEGLNLFITYLLSEDNLDTAAMFFNQLGLSENIVKLICKEKDKSLDKGYKNFDKIKLILNNADSQIKCVKDELEKLGNFDDASDYETTIKDFEKRIIQECDNIGYKAASEIFSKSIEKTFKIIKRFPNKSKTEYLNKNIDKAVSKLKDVVKDDISELNTPLLMIKKRYDLVNKLLLPDNTNLKEDIEKYFKSVEDFLLYQNKNKKAYSYVGISIT